jgi:hypothetical protein
VFTEIVFPGVKMDGCECILLIVGAFSVCRCLASSLALLERSFFQKGKARRLLPQVAASQTLSAAQPPRYRAEIMLP